LKKEETFKKFISALKVLILAALLSAGRDCVTILKVKRDLLRFRRQVE